MSVGFGPFMLLGLLSSIGWVLLIAGAVVLIIWAVRAAPANALRPAAAMPSGVPNETPLDILARRFALGEITAEEYQRARDVLRGEPPAKP
jgi:uncharacterized membrane protein